MNDSGSIAASMNAIITNANANAGYKTLKPPIGASIKVAVDAVVNPGFCNRNDIPRSLVNGFDFDGRARTLSLFGACRPATQSTQAAAHCSGPTLGCSASGSQCVCNPNCGNTCGSGTQCNRNSCTCEVSVGLTPGR